MTDWHRHASLEQSAYEEGFREGREYERAVILAWLRKVVAPWHGAEFLAEDIASLEHLRADDE